MRKTLNFTQQHVVRDLIIHNPRRETQLLMSQESLNEFKRLDYRTKHIRFLSLKILNKTILSSLNLKYYPYTTLCILIYCHLGLKCYFMADRGINKTIYKPIKGSNNYIQGQCQLYKWILATEKK